MGACVETSVKLPGSGSEVVGAVVDAVGGVVAVTSIGGVAGVVTGEGVGEGSGELSCSSIAMVAYTCFLCADGKTTVVGQCGGGVGIVRVVAGRDVVGAGESTSITGGAGAT